MHTICNLCSFRGLLSEQREIGQYHANLNQKGPEFEVGIGEGREKPMEVIVEAKEEGVLVRDIPYGIAQAGRHG